MNLVRYLAKEGMPGTTERAPGTESAGGAEIRIFTRWSEEDLPEFSAPSPAVRIIRRGGRKTSKNPLLRLLSYGWYYFSTSLHLLRWRPDTVLAIETLSFFPAWFYKRWVAPRSVLMIHYHEYTSLSEYAGGMALNKWQHSLECSLYPRTGWLSHTNEDRMARFLDDHKQIAVPHPRIVPNFPPGAWIRREPKPTGNPLRVVLIGSVGLQSMYIKEFAEWVVEQKGSVTWDIYALHLPDDARKYLSSVQPDLIRFKGSCYYYDLPSLLADYHVGVVLYKGVSPNHVYAVSNKVQEYAVCGLDVWYAREMLGTHPYNTPETVYPRILPLDFTNMRDFDPNAALDRTGKQFVPAPYNYEEALRPLAHAIWNSGTQ